jgi:hypothetical protein
MAESTTQHRDSRLSAIGPVDIGNHLADKLEYGPFLMNPIYYYCCYQGSVVIFFNFYCLAIGDVRFMDLIRQLRN